MAIRDIRQWVLQGYLFHTQQVCTSSHVACSKAQGFSQEESVLQCEDDLFRGETGVVLTESVLGQKSVSQPFGAIHRVDAFLAVFFFFPAVFFVDRRVLGCLWYTY